MATLGETLSTIPLIVDSGLGVRKIWRGVATTVSGVATFNTTAAGFSTVLGAIATPLLAAATAITVAFCGLKTLTTTQVEVNVIKGVNLAALGNTVVFVADGTAVYCEVWGT